MAPYRSEAQRKFFHSPGAKAKGIKAKDVKEFDKASKGLKLPYRVGKSRLERMIKG
jgi:hypothetical protein